MASITSLGIGSGIDINGLVTQLIDSEKELPELRMNSREAELQAQLSSFGTLKGALSSFQTKINNMRTPSGLTGLQSVVSDRSVLTTSVSSTAEPGKHTIEVKSLAQSHTIASAAFENESTDVGTGTLSFSFGTNSYDPDGVYTGFVENADITSKDVTITDGTLEGIRDAVNSADVGVTASIVNVGPEGYKLLFSGNELGEDKSLKVTVADADTDNLNNAGLSQLAYSVDAINMDETAQAKHAELLYNGLTIKRDTNTVDDLIKGVTLNLRATTETDKNVVVDVSKDTNALKSKAKTFVDGFNELITTVNSLTSYNAETETGGILLGDAITRNITNQLRRAVGESVKIGDNNTISLASVGIRTQADGTLSFNEETFDAEAKKDPAVVSNLLSMTGNTQGSDLKYIGVSSKTEVGTYRINVSQPATQGTYTASDAIGDPSFTINGSNDTFKINVDGVESGSINIAHGAYGSAESLATKIRASINNDSKLQDAGISVSVDIQSDKLIISSDLYGSKSQVSMVSASGLGLSGGDAVTGVDIAGSFGVGAAVGEGQFLRGTSGAVQGLQIEYVGATGGNVGAVTASRGFADKLYNIIDQFLVDDGGIEGKTAGIQDSIIDINEQRVALDTRLLSMEKRLRIEFGAMDALVARMQSTGNFLTQQLESLPKIQVRR